MLRRSNRRRFGKQNEDPMAGTANLVDAMLVLSVGFLIFLVLSWNMQSVLFADMSPEERQQTMEAMRQVAEIEMGEEIDETPDVSTGSGEGFVPLGRVYRDPETDRLIMIEGG